MRIGIDYTAAINQTAGIGRFVRNLVHAVANVDHENQYVLVHAAPNYGRRVEAPMAPNFTMRKLRFRERYMTIMWHRMHLPLPVDGRHFDRWLALFEATARELCPPQAADHFIERAQRIARSMGDGTLVVNKDQFDELLMRLADEDPWLAAEAKNGRGDVYAEAKALAIRAGIHT